MSDVFNEYAKIAVEQGLIKEAEAGDEPNQRYDSLTNDDLRALYGLKPNGEDEKHIVEQAHPDPVVVSPAYDKANGLVENLLERQDIMAWIATKPNDGKHTMERYVKANQDLTMTLLNTAMILDRTGDHKLMSLADSCAKRTVLRKKEALAPIVLWGLGAGALALVGLVNNFGGMMDAGVSNNSARAIEELQDILDDGDMPGKESDIQRLINDITYVHSVNQALREFNIESNDEAGMKSEISQGKSLLSKYIKGVKYLNIRITNFMAMAEAQGIEDGTSSWLNEWMGDFGAGVDKIRQSFWGSDLRDAYVVLETLKESLRESIPEMSKLYKAIKAKANTDNYKELESLLKLKITDEEEPQEEEGPFANLSNLENEEVS